MSSVHKYNKNNRKDTKRDEFAWHNEILNNRLRFICLFIIVNEMAKTYEDFRDRKVRRIGQTLRYEKSFKLTFLQSEILNCSLQNLYNCMSMNQYY